MFYKYIDKHAFRPRIAIQYSIKIKNLYILLHVYMYLKPITYIIQHTLYDIAFIIQYTLYDIAFIYSI